MGYTLITFNILRGGGRQNITITVRYKDEGGQDQRYVTCKLHF